MVTTSIKKRAVKNFKYLCFVIAILFGTNVFSQSTYNVENFEKVVVNPHIQVTFVQGDETSVTVNSNLVSNDKLNVEVKGNTLHIYLDGARVYTKSEKCEENNWKAKRSLYHGTIVTATIYYKTINSLSLRGEENFVFESLIKQDKLKLKVYGEPQISFNALELKELNTTMYGAGILEVKTGSIENNRTTCFGECKVNTPDIRSRKSKVTAFGEGEFNLNVSDHLKVTAFGEATVSYQGNPEVNKGIILGEATIKKTK
ncbi:hypothetical protein MHTCC0001_19140 [Flavobacteriaceae bacterium MHTCC 0001]